MLAEVLEPLKSRYDYILIDTGPACSLWKRALSPCPFDWSLCISRPCSVLPGR